MGCSCNKNKQGSRSATPPPRMATNNRMGQTTRRTANPTSMQSLNTQRNLNPAGINAERRRLQTERRQAIRNRMNQS